MAVGAPSDGFIPSDYGELLQRKTFDYKGTDIQKS